MERALTTITALTLATFRADLRSAAVAEEWRGSWATALLYRRPAVYLAYMANRADLRPGHITGMALVLALTLPIQAALLPLGLAVWGVALTGCLFQIVDCTDGTLARVTGQTSRRGADMDFLVDMAQWGLLYLAIGILADRISGGGYLWTAVAATAAWARLLARVARDRLAHMATAAAKPRRNTAIDAASLLLGGVSGLLPFLALAGSALPWAVGFLMLYALLDIGEGVLPLLRR